jgi:tetratricopeptide (TPR) repeat protein
LGMRRWYSAGMGKFRAVWAGAVLCCLIAGVRAGGAQTQQSLQTLQLRSDDRLAPQDAATRDALLRPGIGDLNRGENAAALSAFLSVLTRYPDDLIVLRYSAVAAMAAGQNEQALGLFHRALDQIPQDPWPLRLRIIVLEARTGRWEDFDHDVKVLRQAKKNHMDHGLDGNEGFIIDEFDTARGRIQGVIYPAQSSRYHTLYRFLLPVWMEINARAQADAAKKEPSRCVNPDYQPHFDAESDDIDQEAFAKANPGKAAKGERSYSLDSYGSPCTQALVKFYPDGEPTYETVRADVIKALASPAAAAKP